MNFLHSDYFCMFINYVSVQSKNFFKVNIFKSFVFGIGKGMAFYVKISLRSAKHGYFSFLKFAMLNNLCTIFSLVYI